MTSEKKSRDQFIDWARLEKFPLIGIEPSIALDDLEPLTSIVGKARIVGVGESWHSTRQLLQLKHRIAHFLVERLGFNVVVFEGGLPGSPRADAFVNDGEGDAATALRAFGQPMWLNLETIQLLEWLRGHNSAVSGGEKVRVFGLDPVYPAAAADSVLSYLDRVDPTYAVPYRALIATVAKAFWSVPLHSLAKSAVWGATDVYEKLSPAEQQQFFAVITEIIARLSQKRATYSHRSSDQEFEWNLQQAVILLQTFDVISVRSRSLSEANDARDHAFSENLAWILNRMGGDARAIVFGHNMHVSRDPFKSDLNGPSIDSMGGHLSRWYGKDYVAIGTAVGRGRMGGGDAGLAGTPDGDKRTLADRSIDAALEEVGSEFFLLDVRKGPNWTKNPHLARSHLDPQPEYVVARAFDALAYVDRIERCSPTT